MERQFRWKPVDWRFVTVSKYNQGQLWNTEKAGLHESRSKSSVDPKFLVLHLTVNLVLYFKLKVIENIISLDELFLAFAAWDGEFSGNTPTELLVQPQKLSGLKSLILCAKEFPKFKLKEKVRRFLTQYFFFKL